jgi:REP element-mobilizing transposase RayT
VLDDHDRELFVSRLGTTVARHGWSCLAYCLLDTHAHLLIGDPRGSLSAGMQSLLGPYAQKFNARHEREGHLFRGRFYSKRVRSQSHLISTLVYISLNPVRAGLIERPEAWIWGSYSATIARRPASAFLDVEATLGLVHSDRDSARTLLQIATLDALDR